MKADPAFGSHHSLLEQHFGCLIPVLTPACRQAGPVLLSTLRWTQGKLMWRGGGLCCTKNSAPFSSPQAGEGSGMRTVKVEAENSLRIAHVCSFCVLHQRIMGSRMISLFKRKILQHLLHREFLSQCLELRCIQYPKQLLIRCCNHRIERSEFLQECHLRDVANPFNRIQRRLEE